MQRSWLFHRIQILDALAGEGTCRHRHWTLASARECADEMAQEWTIARVVRRHRLSRPCYDKPHRCPGWAGGGTRYARGGVHSMTYCNNGSIRTRKPEPGYPGEFVYPGGARWHFGYCNACEVVTWPYVVRWLDWRWWTWVPGLARRRMEWWGWRIGVRARRIFSRVS